MSGPNSAFEPGFRLEFRGRVFVVRTRRRIVVESIGRRACAQYAGRAQENESLYARRLRRTSRRLGQLDIAFPEFGAWIEAGFPQDMCPAGEVHEDLNALESSTELFRGEIGACKLDDLMSRGTQVRAADVGPKIPMHRRLRWWSWSGRARSHAFEREIAGTDEFNCEITNALLRARRRRTLFGQGRRLPMFGPNFLQARRDGRGIIGIEKFRAEPICSRCTPRFDSTMRTPRDFPSSTVVLQPSKSDGFTIATLDLIRIATSREEMLPRNRNCSASPSAATLSRKRA